MCPRAEPLHDSERLLEPLGGNRNRQPDVLAKRRAERAAMLAARRKAEGQSASDGRRRHDD